MKYKFFSTLFIVLIWVSCENKQTTSAKKIRLRVKGSDTVFPLTKLFCTAFQQQHKNYVLSIEGGGTTSGIRGLLNNECEIAAASRELKISEKEKIDSLKMQLSSQIIAYDGLAVIVNLKNKKSQITCEQLVDIYRGKIINWWYLGGSFEKIVVYALDKTNGTDEFFRDKIMGEKNYSSSVIRVNNLAQLAKRIAENKGAIGYCNINALNEKTNYLSISFDSSKTFIAPNSFNVQNRTYKISRSLQYFYETSKQEIVQPLLDFSKSNLGKRNVVESGFIPIQ